MQTMFGYKLEIWKYDSAQCEAAEKHLQDMAEKGYEFTGVKSYMWPFVVYKKHDRPVRKKYSVAMMPGDDAILAELCRESGWEILGDSMFGMTICAADNPDAKPIFTDEESRLEMWKEMFEHSRRDKGFVLFLLAAGAVWFISEILKHDDKELLISFFLPSGLILLTGVLWAGSSFVEERIIDGNYKAMMEGTEYKSPGWIKLFYILKFPVMALACIAVFFINRLPLFMVSILWSALTIILDLGIFTAGAVLYGRGISPRLGKVLISLAIWLEVMIGHFARECDLWSNLF